MASVTSVQHTQVPPAAVVCLDSVSDQDLHAANAVELERLDTSSARQPSVLLATAQASSKFHASQPVPPQYIPYTPGPLMGLFPAQKTTACFNGGIF